MFCVFITVFGEKELQVLCQRFAEVLQHAGVAGVGDAEVSSL